MSMTDELRRLLDERGVEHDTGETVDGETVATFWHDREGYPCSAIEGADDIPDGEISMQACVTPEQAIDVTLGGGECIPHGEWKRISQTQEVRHVFCECGYELGMDERDSFPFECTRLFAMPNYCQECGRKIRKAVKR